VSRSVSLTARQALYAQETGEVFLVLLTIDHADLASPIRVSSDAVDTLSRGDTYVAFPFRLSLPEDGDDRPPRARLAIDNVDRTIVQSLRQIGSAPRVLIEVVRGADPDSIEAAFPDFELTDAHYDALTVQGDLTLESFLREPYPAALFTPADFPGLF
jgi:hypothetical protein